MKLSQTGLKTPIEKGLDLLIFVRPRLSLTNARWGIQRGAQFSTSIAPLAKSQLASRHGYRNTIRRTTRGDEIEILGSKLPKAKVYDPRAKFVQLLHQVEKTLEPKAYNEPINPQNQHPFRNATPRTHSLVNNRKKSVAAKATFNVKGNRKHNPGNRFHERDARLSRISVGKVRRVETGEFGFHESNARLLRISAGKVRRVCYSTPAEMRKFRAEASTQHQTISDTDEYPSSSSQAQSKLQESPSWFSRVRRLLVGAERPGLLHLAMNRENFRSYPAIEDQTGSEKKNSHNKSRMLIPDSKEGQAAASVPRLSNLMILAGYIDLQNRKIHLTSQDYNISLLRLFDDRAMHLIHKGGYDVEDIVAWAWILSPKSNYDATLRLLLWTNRPMPAPRVPVSIFRILLERNIREARVVQPLTVHLWHRLTNRIDGSWEELYRKFSPGSILSHQIPTQQEEAQSANYQSVGSQSVGSQYHPRLGMDGLRLIELASTSMPALFPNIATMLCKYLRPCPSQASVREDGLSLRSSIHLTTQFNNILVKLATTTLEPYNSVPYQERAQFIVIHRMNEFQPPLVLGRAAYRAVISVQLRNRKTVKERVWAGLKSRGWPPYREDKIGLDAKKKDEVYGISRAHQAIVNMKEAGYAAEAWEDSASVLSGWDVNRSPTIQTRKVFSLDLAKGRSQSVESSRLWESRIRSTRTVQEAWAAFLNYMEENIPRDPGVFLAMFEKIAEERKRKQSSVWIRPTMSAEVLAGDVPEVFPSSLNPRDMVYTPSLPPSYEDFYQQYKAQFPFLSNKALRFLLSNAESLEQGYEYIQTSYLPGLEKDILLRHQIPTKNTTSCLPSIVLNAYIRMLSNFASDPLPNDDRVSALTHAIFLVCSLKPVIRGPWFFLLRALQSEVRKLTSRKLWDQNWNIVTNVLNQMESTGVSHDSDTFGSVCAIFTDLLRSSSQGSVGNRYNTRNTTTGSSSDLLKRAAQLLKRIFKNLVSSDQNLLGNTKQVSSLPFDRSDLASLTASTQFEGASSLPQLLCVPSPAAIHLFVRLLGSIEDREAVVDVVKWMSLFDAELRVKRNGLASGQKYLRWTLNAVRIIVETPSQPFTKSMDMRQLSDPKSEHAISAKSIVEKMEIWGGWPDDDETAEYMQLGGGTG